MKAEEQRIAIAEFCRWKIEEHSQGRRLIHPDGHVVNNHYAEPWRLPDYLNDLNAIHEAEKCFRNQLEERRYFLELAKLTTKSEDWPESLVRGRALITATAAQRAEALLRTIGKWKE